MLSDILEAKTFGDVYDTVKAAHGVAPMDVPNAEQQLARIVGGVFTLEVEGDFAAPTAGRLMYEVSVGVVATALDDKVEDYRPLRWEVIKPDDRPPVYVAALLCSVKPHLSHDDWTVLGGELFTHWARTGAFPQDKVKQLEKIYKELTDGQAS